MIFSLLQKGAAAVTEGSDVEDEEDVYFDDEDFEGDSYFPLKLICMDSCISITVNIMLRSYMKRNKSLPLHLWCIGR